MDAEDYKAIRRAALERLRELEAEAAMHAFNGLGGEVLEDVRRRIAYAEKMVFIGVDSAGKPIVCGPDD